MGKKNMKEKSFFEAVNMEAWGEYCKEARNKGGVPLVFITPKNNQVLTFVKKGDENKFKRAFLESIHEKQHENTAIFYFN